MKNADIAKAMTIKLEFPNGLPPKKPSRKASAELLTAASASALPRLNWH